MKKSVKWNCQLNESTNTGENTQLMVFVRYEDETNLKEEFMFFKPLAATATGADIYVVDHFQQKGVWWENCVSVCTVGAPAMLGARHGFAVRVNLQVEVIHCLVNGENLAVQHLSLELLAIMQEIVAVVNI